MTTNLFEDLIQSPLSNGNKKIQFELKGADYNETLFGILLMKRRTKNAQKNGTTFLSR
jgi:hypothetical protein